MLEVEDGWELRLDLPDLDCLEYLFDVDGTLASDPGNPDRVEGAFGPHSWLAHARLPAPDLARHRQQRRGRATS